MTNKLIYLVVIVLLVGGAVYAYLNFNNPTNLPPSDACTLEGKVCSDGTVVGRTGPNCEFAACPVPEVPDDLMEHINSKADLIRLENPAPMSSVSSPLTITGEARGYWFFEATFPIVLVNWDGLIIAEGYAEAEGEWMTEEFVPYSATLEFVSPYQPGDPDFMQRGALILQRSNASGLPEHDDALEVPVLFE